MNTLTPSSDTAAAPTPAAAAATITARRIGVLLVNLGTPDSPNTPDVRRYLNEFLTDGRVMDMPAAIRYPLFQGLVVPLRAPKSAKIYQQLWTERGSPLLFHGLDLQQKVQEELGAGYVVAFGMRYQNPSIASALKELQRRGRGAHHGAAAVSAVCVGQHGLGAGKGDGHCEGLVDSAQHQLHQPVCHRAGLY